LGLAYPPFSVGVKSDDPQGTLSLYNSVTERALRLSREPFQPTDRSLPPELASLDYDRYQRIDFRHQRSLWRNNRSGFELQPLHRGYIQSGRVKLNIVEDGQIRTLGYDPGLFDFDGLTRPEQPTDDLGYSGLRLLGHLDSDGTAREFLVFQGASYFRALAAGTAYGLSARGLALRTGNPAGEEFPSFTEMWIERPEPGTSDIKIHALLDSPSVTGAFMFTVRTGSGMTELSTATTRIGVNATLYPRVDLDHVGIAPLTSMYWFGPLERGAVDDYRLRVHDSDGLALCNSVGAWQWRPLANPTTLRVSSFADPAGGRIRGFGLVQRERAWESYQDMGADYHLRPDCWVEPHAEWPAGRVELIEIPTNSEYHDNIVAYWRPDAVMATGSEIKIGYDLVWSARAPSGIGLLRAVTSSSGAIGRQERQVVIDFSADTGKDRIASDLFDDFWSLKPHVVAKGAKIRAETLALNREIGGLRLSFTLDPGDEPSEVVADITQAGRPVSETWRYHFEHR
jgi:glucans biosynthesis protein